MRLVIARRAARAGVARCCPGGHSIAKAPSFPVVSEAAVTIPDAHARADWLNGLAAPDVITIAVVTTPGMVQLAPGWGAYGYHREWGEHVLFATAGGDGVSGMDAIIAHELGYAFGLPDMVGTMPKDIMEYPHPAFYDGYLSAADAAAVCAAPPVHHLWSY